MTHLQDNWDFGENDICERITKIFCDAIEEYAKGFGAVECWRCSNDPPSVESCHCHYIVAKPTWHRGEVDMEEETTSISEEELYELVRRAYNEVNHDYLVEQTAVACRYCPNNPANGGSGICHCLLGQPVIF